MENKLPTAEEFLDCKSSDYDYFDKELELIKNKMIEFAKLHCIEQAKVISEKAKAGMNFNFTGNVPYVITSSILNAYNLDEIK